MKKNFGILGITRTALFIALLIVMQAVTAPLGNTLITGSLVNLLLIVSVVTCGLFTGITVSVLSPVLAKLLGIGPLWSLIPFIILGNLTLISVWQIANAKTGLNKPVFYLIALVSAAAAKFLVLYIGIVRIAVPLLLHLPEKQSALISGIFSVPQLITALIGGALATAILPVLRKVIKKQ